MRRTWLILILLLLLVLFGIFYCRHHQCNGHFHIGQCKADTAVHWISWNLLFTPSSTGTSNNTVQAFETYLTNYVHDSDATASLTFEIKYCPCDSLITNIDATLISESGKIITPPTTKPNPGPSGDYFLGQNVNTYIPGYLDTNFYNTSKVVQIPATVSTVSDSAGIKKLLAVIDTGLDTTLFKLAYPQSVWNGDLLWQETGKSSLFDVVSGEGANNLMDNSAVKHGTAVTQVALQQILALAPTHIPQIMSIRAFDDSEKGSIYTVSCALSYAVQHHADYINASWGYFGPEDSVLKSYISKADKQGIRILAAAGNTPGTHLYQDVCNPVSVNPVSSLDAPRSKDSLFYPACFARDMQNVISVTQMHFLADSITVIPCFFQDYSSHYITIGAVDLAPPINCCSFVIPFLSSPIEGSSFATPVITGILMSKDLDSRTNIKKYIISSTKPPVAGLPLYTESGRYFTYIQHH